MATPVGSLLRVGARKVGEPLNVLTFPTHERTQSNVAKCGHNFYLAQAPGIKTWNSTYAPLPSNHFLLDPSKGDRQIPDDVNFDLVLSQNKFGQWQLASQLARHYHLPLVSLEHTLPVPSWPREQLQACYQMRGHINVFISEYSRREWGWGEGEAEVIHHGVDTSVFKPFPLEKKRHCLSVVNDFVNRDIFCGFRLWQQTTQGLPVHVLGDTPGLSRPAGSVQELVQHYNEAQVFLNTSLVSPIPTVVLEAMACGCAVASTSNCMLPEIIEHGVNGLLSNDPAELAGFCRMLLDDAGLCRRLGEAARRTVLERFSMGAFLKKWNDVFERASKMVYTGTF